MFGPCRGHVLSSFTSRPTRVLKFSRLTHYGLRHMNMEYILLWTMSKPCWDHVWTMFGLTLLADGLELYLQTSYISEILKTKSTWLRPMSKECLCFEPCQDYVWTMFGITLLPDQLEF